MRYGEIGTKSPRVRPKFERTLVKNIKNALKRERIKAKVRREYGRIFVETEEIEKAKDTISRIFGVVSLSPAFSFPFQTLRDIVAKGKEIFCADVKGKRFAIRARRAGRHEFTSMDVARELGAELVNCGGKVDLESPEMEVFVEVRQNHVYFYTEVIEGPGGLPLGTSSRILHMFSGGIDSPVAAWLLMKRGAPLDFLFFKFAPGHEMLVAQVYNKFVSSWYLGLEPKIFLVDFLELIEQLVEKVEGRMRQIVLKALMYMCAEHFAKKSGAKALSTGESLAQASTQTLECLCALQGLVGMPVLRPLIGMDKVEIEGLARRIGTYELSKHMPEFCALVKGPVVTRVSKEELERELEKIDFDLEGLWEERKEIKGLMPEEEKEEIPEEFEVIDLEAVDLNAVLKGEIKLSKSKVYLFTCPLGLTARFVAKKMREKGYRAYGASYKELEELRKSGQNSKA